MTAVRDGEQITFTEVGDVEAAIFQRVVTDQANPIVGRKLDNETGGISVFTFLPSGDFMLGCLPNPASADSSVGV